MNRIVFKKEEYSWKKMDLWRFLEEGNFPRLCKEWEKFFISESQKLYDISNSIKDESQNCTIYPPINLVFRAFIPMDKIKVVIIGQDPYHNGSAVGLCFSVKNGNSINPSLRTIYKELKNEGYNTKEDGDLTHWAEQGCMMLNTALTVEKGCPEIHLGIWYEFTEKVISYVSKKCENVAFLLMGSKALKFKELIESNKGHRTFITSHPMPLSAYKGFRGHDAFIGSNVFNVINQFLIENGKTAIKW